ncbi:cytochrome P450 6k1-like [Bacillus rossius redtenbacheri]|uniref:cytochrome P450 6k1-like n=1 Tax=Bacillus rossius redtenbacheri TaxID=93214 RepID=UPI002FDD1780
MFDFGLLDFVVLAVIAGLLIYFYYWKQFRYWRNKGVPYAEPEFFFGNFKEMFFQRKSFAHFIQDLHMQGKGHPLFGFYIFGRPALLLRDPQMIKHVFVKDFGHFVDRYAKADFKHDPLGSRNLFMEKGQPWRHMRTKITPVFTSGKMRRMFPLVTRCGENLQEYLDEIGARGTKPVEIRETMARFATDVISTCAYGVEANSMKDKDAEFRKFGRIVFEFDVRRTLEIMVIFFVPAFVKLGLFKFFSPETTKYLRKVFWEVITVREKNNIKRNDLIDLLIQLKNQGRIEDEGVDDNEKSNQPISKTSDFTDDDLVAQAAIFFTAGYETNSSTLCFCLYELSGAPDIQQRLRRDIVDTLERHGGEITYEAMQEMTYLEKVVSETLRKYPPVGFLDRVCTKDYVLPDAGVHVQKGTPVYVPVHGIHRDPEFYPDPESFDPERFSEQSKQARTPYTYLSFGEGPHNCIGLRFAQMTVKTSLVHVLSRYEVRRCSETPASLEFSTKAIILAATEDIKLVFRPLADGAQ